MMSFVRHAIGLVVVLIAVLLSYLARYLINVGAWLTDNEDELGLNRCPMCNRLIEEKRR